MVAVERGHVEALAALVNAKVDVNLGNPAATTPIGRAIGLGNLALVKQLLRGGARVNDKAQRLATAAASHVEQLRPPSGRPG